MEFLEVIQRLHGTSCEVFVQLLRDQDRLTKLDYLLSTLVQQTSVLSLLFILNSCLFLERLFHINPIMKH